MRKAIGILALLLTTGMCGEARSAGGHQGGGVLGGSGGFDRNPYNLGYKRVGASNCSDDVWCPVYVYFTFYPDAGRQQTLREYVEWSKRPIPGMNPDVMAIPPLPYGPGRTGPGARAPHAAMSSTPTTTVAPPAAAAAPPTAAPANAPTPPPPANP